MDVDLDQLRELMKALNEFELDELELKQGEERILLRRKSAGGAMMSAPAAMGSYASAAPPAPPPAELADATYVTSPFVGTFYRSPSPDADPFVKEGSSFSQGESLCIVEAMKLMNEIEADFDGVVLEVLVENGKPVEYGDRLFRVEKK